MTNKLNINLVQLLSGDQVDKNLSKIDFFLKRSTGSDLVIFPENSLINCHGSNRKNLAKKYIGDALKECRLLARKYSLSFIIGSIPEFIEGEDKTYQTLIWFDEEGEIITRYRKIHLFKISSTSLNFDESTWIKKGEVIPSIQLFKGWRFGLSICYDLRFPELYRSLSLKGAEVFVVPSAFTTLTGKAHWHPLLRARAIENLAYVLGVNQYGKGVNEIENYGHTLAVSPWGEVIDDQKDEEGMISIQLNKKELLSARTQLNALEHQRIKVGPLS
jgi:deaminated glutathione amidase